MPTLPGTFSTILIDPPWRLDNRTGKLAPEHRRLNASPATNGYTLPASH